MAAGRLSLKKFNRPAEALRFYKAAAESPVPHLDWAANIQAGIQEAQKVLAAPEVPATKSWVSAVERARPANALKLRLRSLRRMQICTNSYIKIYRLDMDWLLYAELAARIGIVTLDTASEDASMWQRPSKMPPGSITMHGEWTSPVTTPFASISTRPLAKITPSNRPEITTRFPSIWPSTLAPSPRMTVCSEMMFPFTFPLMRNVPVTVSVPSSATPWSMNPVHSSLLAPFGAVPGHFHAMAIPQERLLPL